MTLSPGLLAFAVAIEQHAVDRTTREIIRPGPLFAREYSTTFLPLRRTLDEEAPLQLQVSPRISRVGFAVSVPKGWGGGGVPMHTSRQHRTSDMRGVTFNA